jgi:type I restriction-modification system DNA methylase subunit
MTSLDEVVLECRGLGAPIVFVRFGIVWQIWKQSPSRPELLRMIPRTELQSFFEEHGYSLSPGSIYRAKTWGRFDTSFQLDFVDVGLMPLVEEETGRRLSGLIERIFIESRHNLGWKDLTESREQWLLQANFWLLAAKMLQDKGVPSFTSLDLCDVPRVFESVEAHYGAKFRFDVGRPEHVDALRVSAGELKRFSSLGLVSTEALAYLYENALISKETRNSLGTHSTPAYLIDYVLGRLRGWVAETPIADRNVFEPACGHAGFLLSAMRLLDELRLEENPDPIERHGYLRSRLHGWDIDTFALEIARLRLTLADVPNPNGWDLQAKDVFRGRALEEESNRASLILANPPFEAFSGLDRESYRDNSVGIEQTAKGTEIFRRVLSGMRPGAAFGFVLPQNFLQGQAASPVRKMLATSFELQEICLLPDKVFTHSDSEIAVLIGRKRTAPYVGNVRYTRVRESDYGTFQRSSGATVQSDEPMERFRSAEAYSFAVPELEAVWESCSGLLTFDNIAMIGQGLSFKSTTDPEFPIGEILESPVAREGFYPGFSKWQDDVHLNGLPEETWLNLNSALLSRSRHGTTTGIAQVLMNYAPSSRGPWRIKALLDTSGHAISSRFLAIRPRDARWSVESLWALCNSPFANAYVYAYATKRDITAGLMRRMPIPTLVPEVDSKMRQMVRDFFQSARTDYLDEDRLRLLHWRIDAEILRLYGLAPEVEGELLRLFRGVERRGVPYTMHGYVPDESVTSVSLRDYIAITSDWQEINRRRGYLITQKVARTISDEEFSELQVLQHLADARIRLLAPIPTEVFGALELIDDR